MHQSILDEVIRVCRQRRDDGDCPTVPAEPVERLEEAVLQLVHEDEEHLRQALEWHDELTLAVQMCRALRAALVDMTPPSDPAVVDAGYARAVARAREVLALTAPMAAQDSVSAPEKPAVQP